eukprot:874009-Prymnesium_polylepis.1
MASQAADIWVELNKPPINLNPFEVNPVGWIFFALYGGYLTWQIAKPQTEGEKVYAEKVTREAEEAGAMAGDFIAAAAAAEGAQVLPSGLVFLETSPGSGENPALDSKVVVHCAPRRPLLSDPRPVRLLAAPREPDARIAKLRLEVHPSRVLRARAPFLPVSRVADEGKLADGNVFDSSLARGEPAEFKVGQVIKGWQEGLQLMKPGSKATLTIPANLAYGAMNVGSIPGNSALQFQVELLEVKEGGGLLGMFSS